MDSKRESPKKYGVKKLTNQPRSQLAAKGGKSLSGRRMKRLSTAGEWTMARELGKKEEKGQEKDTNGSNIHSK